MKKYPFLVLFFVVFASAQTYEFDYKCYNPENQTRGHYKGVKRTNIIYLSSKESDIIAYDYSFSAEPKRSFYFYDFKNNFFSYYTLNNESDLSSLKLNTKPLEQIKTILSDNNLKLSEIDCVICGDNGDI